MAPPHLPSVHIERDDLRRVLDDGARVVSVVAPAGYGKTVLVREWLDRRRVAGDTAWYSVDALDGNPLCFWRHVVAAIAAVREVRDEVTQILLDRGADDLGFLHSLLDDLLSSPRPLVLVLDDLHVLRDRGALDALALLVERAGPDFRLVFTARFDPSLPLARWRSQGVLTEVRHVDLRFGSADAANLLRGYECGDLDGVELQRLVEGTEGWVTGLQLAALARPDHVADALLDVRSRGTLIAAYLASEVVDRLTTAQRAFVFQVAVLPEFDVDIAAELTGRADAAGTIDALEAGNVFIVRLGAGEARYRFHHLFRALLLREFRLRDPVGWDETHRRAAALLARDGRPDVAFELLVSIGDPDRAVELVVRPALSLSDQGWSREFRRWLEQLPIGDDVDDPAQMLDLAFATFIAGLVDDSVMWIDRAAARLPANDLRVAGRRLAVAVATGDVAAGEAALAAAAPVGVEFHPEAGPFEDRIDLTAARLHVLRGDAAAASAMIERTRARGLGEVVGTVGVSALRARVCLLSGAVLEASAQARESLAAADRNGAQRNPAVLEALIAASGAAIAADRLDEASAFVDQLLDVIDSVDFPYARAHAAALLVQLHGQRHGWAATAGFLDELCERAGWHDGDPLAWLVDPVRARALAAAGRIDEAAAVAASLPDSPQARIASAHVLLAQRRHDDVVRLLADRSKWAMPDDVEARVVSALAMTGLDAEQELIAAVQRADGSGLIAPFLQRGPDLDRLLRRLPPDVLGELHRHEQPAPAATDPRRAMIEPLSPREAELLAMLPTHLSNQALAQRMFVSVNTVKTMLKSIYRKLGTGSRDETVTVARRLGLLPADPAAATSFTRTG